MLSEGVILLHDNAGPHTACKTQEFLQKFKWEIWSHPPYSPDLARSDYFLFLKLNEHLCGTRLSSDNDVRTGSMGRDVISTKPG
ncbi:hypothetical protein AVEN_143266-1 [Araneus ventricosus]|uniref:Histone-lysine N-methyltransferase SETMAR n=1 Tax=Araneus ventricosus TaxID=182803 RepID=A0A4Y2AFC6_ARAVE|nr:hypothetical protein AVEN_143266-1 [Araneus ventricosus]